MMIMIRINDNNGIDGDYFYHISDANNDDDDDDQ